jgi:hypothetical protein
MKKESELDISDRNKILQREKHVKKQMIQDYDEE